MRQHKYGSLGFHGGTEHFCSDMMLPRKIRWHVQFAIVVLLWVTFPSTAFVVPTSRPSKPPHNEGPRQIKSFLPSEHIIDHSSTKFAYPCSNQRIDTTISRKRRASNLQLHLVPPLVGASVALAGSSLIGHQISRWFPSGGILGTLVSAASMANLFSKYVPRSHPLYDLSFTVFLPGSLTLLLLAYQPPPPSMGGIEGIDSTSTTEWQNTQVSPVDEYSIAACIIRVALPFAIASLASLVGCWLSYLCAVRFRWFSGIRHYAQAATGCLSASYVGGSVNCMATARLVGAPPDLLGSLVAADLFTMAIYFSFLSSSLEWDWLVTKFLDNTSQGASNSDANSSPNLESEPTSIQLPVKEENTLAPSTTQSSQGHSPSRRSICLASIPLLLGTYGIVYTANRVEDVVGRWIPGTACAVIAVIGPLLNSLVRNQRWWTPFAVASNPLSDILFLSFFASIGLAANLSAALSMGPSCVLFSTIALSSHLLGTVVGCLLLTKLRRRTTTATGWNRLARLVGDIELEDAWIASNAAIGGPATAAAFCSRMTKRCPGKVRGRTISATVWGVVGYAIGTVVGVGMFRLVGGR